MENYRVINKEVQEQILHRIKDEEISTPQAAKDAGISQFTVYKWLSGGVHVEPG